jgi:hypothetical protein
MWGVTHPEYEPVPTFQQCIGKAKQPLRARLDAVVPIVGTAAQDFETAATAGQLHTVPQTTAVSPVTAAEMNGVYTTRMVPAKSPGRPVYDHIFALAGNRCPMCMHREVRTLDHFLPKAHYTLLSVTPLNLVPCCTDCNKAKGDGAPATAEEVTMHPYFDAFDEDLWLRAEVLESQPVSVQFFVAAPSSWNPTTKARADAHFNTFGLADLYASQAANDLSGIRGELETLHASAGDHGVKEHLTERALSWSLHQRNCWQTALYTAISQSQWFWSGGFRLQ